MVDKRRATSWQQETLAAIATTLGTEPEYLPTDDHFEFVDHVCFGYIKLCSAEARKLPTSGIKVIVKEQFWSQIRDDLETGNDWSGHPSRHRLFQAGDPEAAEAAAEILREARAATSRERSQYFEVLDILVRFADQPRGRCVIAYCLARQPHVPRRDGAHA